MSDKPRNKTYVWPTLLAGLLSGDRSCWWSAWYRANNYLNDRLEDDDKAESLTRWKAEHADMVRDRVFELEMAGWKVSVEGQNEVKANGKVVDVVGVPDIVATKPGEAIVEDCKTGKRRDSDLWQVYQYLYLIQLCGHPKLEPDMRVTGAVRYRDGAVDGLALPDYEREQITKAVRSMADATEPARVPSARECSFCSIAACPDRVTETHEANVEEF